MMYIMFYTLKDQQNFLFQLFGRKQSQKSQEHVKQFIFFSGNFKFYTILELSNM